MNTPAPEVAQFAHSELMIQLPPEWPISKEAFEDENNFWPVHWLKSMARFPHEYETWLFEGHTVPNGDPPEPFAANTQFCGWLLFWPLLVEEEFYELKINANKSIWFLSLYPLEKLFDLFGKHGVLDIVDVDRPDVTKMKKGWWPFS